MPVSKRVIDFSNVKEAGKFNPRRKPAGDYRARIESVEDHVKGEGREKKEMWVFAISLTSDRRSTYPYYCGFGEKEAWKIRNLCIAAGIPVPKKKVNLDPTKLIGRELGISLDDDEYDGKPKSVITSTFPADELDETDGPDQ